MFGFTAVGKRENEEDGRGACCQSLTCLNYVGWWVSGGIAQVGSQLIAHWASQHYNVLDRIWQRRSTELVSSKAALLGFCGIRPRAHSVLSESNDVVAGEVGHLFKSVFLCHHLCTLGFGYFYKTSVPHLLCTLRRRRGGKPFCFILASLCLFMLSLCHNENLK